MASGASAPRIPDRPTSRKNPAAPAANGGADRARTDDLRLARAALSQLSYSPARARPPAAPTTGSAAGSTGRGPSPRSGVARMMVGLGRFELPTSRLSGVRSNQLSYRPGRPARPAA